MGKSFPPNNNDQYYEVRNAGSAYTYITEQAAKRALYSQSVNNALGPGKMSFGVIWLLWNWDKKIIQGLTKAAIHTGRHPLVWKQTRRVVIRKPGKYDYTKVKAHHCISLLSCMWKAVEKVVAEILSEEAQWQEVLSGGQSGSTKGWPAIDAAAIKVDTAHAAWTPGHITSVHLMDIKAAFPSMVQGRVVNLIKVRRMDEDLILWTKRFGWEKMVALIIEGNSMERHPVQPRVPQGSAVSQNLFVVYTSGLIKWVEQYGSAGGMSLVDDLGWVVTGSDVDQVGTTLEICTAKSIK